MYWRKKYKYLKIELEYMFPPLIGWDVGLMGQNVRILVENDQQQFLTFPMYCAAEISNEVSMLSMS